MEQNDTIDFSRRKLLASSMALPFLFARITLPLVGGSKALAADGESTMKAKSNILVAYFSRSGNTRVIAGQIKRAKDADLFEILPAKAYPEDYEQTVEQARLERDNAVRPDLKGKVTNLASYDTIYLGLPIWGETAPPIIRSFLAAHDFSGKVIIPFITHGGYGPGSSLQVMKEHAPGAQFQKEFVLEADQEKRTLSKVTVWLDENKP